MINKNILFIVLSLFYIVYCDNSVDFTYSQYTIDKIKQFNIVESCNTISDCPPYAIDCAKDSEIATLHCIYPEYACSETKCYTLNRNKNYNMFLNDDENTSYEALDENNKPKKIIAKSCNTSKQFDRDYDGKLDTCSTAKCNSNDECLSNKCVSGICQINKTSPTYHCKVSGFYYVCNSLLDEHCVSDVNCASVKCHEYDYICVKKTSPVTFKEESSNGKFVIISIILLIVVIIIILLLFCLCLRLAQKKNSRKL